MVQGASEDSTVDKNDTVSHPRLELVVALILSTLILLGPLIYIQHAYEVFVSTKGEPMEGAAGAGLALAVVFRTVSRTILRTVVRTSARAGMRASMKGIFRSALRAGMRNSTANIVKSVQDKLPPVPPAQSIATANLRSLLFASGLLYVSWIIVIGVGQPYAPLLDREASIAQEAKQAAEEAAILRDLSEEARRAYDAEQELKNLQKEYRDLRVKLKGSRNANNREQVEEELNRVNLELTFAERELSAALKASGNRKLAPDQDKLPEELPRFPALEDFKEHVFTYAPFPGPTEWTSPVIWLGGVAMVLPMWFIFAVQSAWARREGLVIRHETGLDGGLIQLYFAGAFSFMPLTSDTIVDDASSNERGLIALIGLVAPTVVGIVLWIVWRMTGQTAILFIADAFMMYPMIQIFPLTPLEGIYLWRYNRVLWLLLFVIIMFLFLFVGSEALRNVI